MPPRRERRELERIDRGIDDELAFGGDLTGLLEETEREARRDPESDVLVAPALGRCSPVRGDLRALRADLEEEAAFVRRLSRAEVLYLDRVRRHALLVIEDLDLDQMRPAHLRAKGESANHGEIAQTELAHEPAHDDEREEHAEQQVEEVVAGVDGGESHAERDADEELPLARDLELSRGTQPLPRPSEAFGRAVRVRAA